MAMRVQLVRAMRVRYRWGHTKTANQAQMRACGQEQMRLCSRPVALHASKGGQATGPQPFVLATTHLHAVSCPSYQRWPATS
eukprot:363718-Chlamydomonas_euryale.AAC.4